MSVKLKVLHLIYEPGHAEAAETVGALAEIAREDPGQLVIEAWAPKSGQPLPHTVNVARESGVYHRGLRASLCLRTYILKQAVNLVHCHDMRSVYAMGALKVARGMPPVVLSLYKPLPPPEPGRPALDALRRGNAVILRSVVDAVLVPSISVKSLVLSHGGFDPARVHKVTICVKVEEGHEGSSQSRPGACIMLLPVEAPPGKARAGFYYFLQAAQVLSREHPKVRFLVVCSLGEADYVEAMAARFGIRDRVSALPAEGFPTSLSRCSIAVVPAGDQEAYRPLLLALARARAVVAPDFRGVREFITPDETGILVRPADSQALASALGRLVVSASARKRLGKAAAEVAADRFTRRRMAGDVLAAYRLLVP